MRVDASAVLSKLAAAPSKADIAIKMLLTEGAKKFQNYARSNRPWTDRTGHARQQLTGYVEDAGTKKRVYIAHGVYYGVYLELCNERRYAILQNTVNAISPEIMKSFNTLLSRIT